MGELWRRWRGGCGAGRHGSGDRWVLLILWVGAGGVVGAMARYLVVGLALTGLVGLQMRDVVLTRDEVDGLMAGLLTSGETPTGTTRLSDWLKDGADGLGRRYVSELTRNWL